MKKLFILLVILFLSTAVYAKDIVITNSKGKTIGKLKFVSGTTYNILDSKGIKIGIYKSTIKLTTANMKGKKFRLIKTGTVYTIK